MRALLLGFAMALSGPLAAVRAAPPDVSADHWAATAIAYVAEQRDWMRDHTDGTFHPSEPVTRRFLARAVVRAFAGGQTSQQPQFADLPASDPFQPFAASAVQRGWMSAPGGVFAPDAAVSTEVLDTALTLALGLTAETQGLSAIGTSDGVTLATPPSFAALILAHQLGLHRNHPGALETLELRPGSSVTRADAAYALHRAAMARASGKLAGLARYRQVTLPPLDPARRAAVEFALAYAGHPYVYAGEWPSPTPSGYCCGPQAAGGFDCSGFVWWVMRAGDAQWNPGALRPYAGWPLPERSSRDMAKPRRRVRSFERVRPLDLMFFDADGGGGGWRGVDHVGLALGNGWMIHSSSGRDGVSIDWIGDGWWRGRWKWGRRLIRP